MNFKIFVETTEYEKDLQKTLKKLPVKFRNLVKGYQLKFQSGNTLKGDQEHIGIINPKKKTLTVCAPYNYSREYTILHEIGHLVWGTLNANTRDTWRKILKKHPSKDNQKQSAEEYFAMAFSDTYANNSVSKFNIQQWHSFIKYI